MSTVTGSPEPGNPQGRPNTQGPANDQRPTNAGGPPTPETPTNPQGLTSADGWYWLTTIFAGVALLAIGWPVYAATYGVWVVIAMLIAVAQAAAPVLAVRLPIVAIVVSLLSSAAGILATAHTTGFVWPWTVTATLSLSFTLIVIGLRHSWVGLIILWSASGALGAGSLLLVVPDGVTGALSNVITTASVTAGVAGIAALIRLWLTGRRQLAAERRLGAEELAKRTELEDRNRIAQELHDVVAHSMSVISVQATTARYRLPDLDDRSLEEFDSIAGSARQALAEMRGLLTILRGGRDADLAPQPTIEDIPSLVSATRGTGAHVDLEFGLGAQPVAPTTGLTAFRVVQEGLSNALRHAPGAPVSVTIRPAVGADGRSGVEVSVVNGVAGGRNESTSHGQSTGTASVDNAAGTGSDSAAIGNAGSHSAISHGAADDRLSHLGAGFGLRGMRERVEGLGGTLAVGPTPDGGFAVTAVLPLS